MVKWLFHHSAVTHFLNSHHQTQCLQVEYTSTQLDFMALLFTVVKLLYIGGALSRCARVVHLLDAASRASAQELHKTLIRNEAAYFGCVKQLVLQHPPAPQPQPAATSPLYLCGDSHCLSGMNVTYPLPPPNPTPLHPPLPFASGSCCSCTWVETDIVCQVYACFQTPAPLPAPQQASGSWHAAPLTTHVLSWNQPGYVYRQTVSQKRPQAAGMRRLSLYAQCLIVE